jgi:hypothetical protein
MFLLIKLLFKKIVNFYIKYKFFILLTALIFGVALASGCLVYLFFIKSIIATKGAVISGVVVTRFSPEVHEEAFNALKEAKAIIEQHAINPAAIIADMCPSHPFKDWLQAVHPRQLMYDQMGRIYYIVNEAVCFEYFTEKLGMRNPSEIQEALANLITTLDPTNYDAVHATAQTAKAAIKENDSHYQIIKDIITDENNLVSKWKLGLLIGAATGIGIVVYSVYKMNVG